MQSKYWLALMASGLIGIVATSQSAKAYDYSVAVSPPTQAFGGSTITLTGHSATGLTGTNTVNFANLADVSITPSPTTDAINENYSLDLTITDPSAGPGIAVFHITGNLSGTSNSTSSNLDNIYTGITPGSQTIGNELFTISVGQLNTPDLFYSPPTVNGSAGSLGGRIAVSTTGVPEPTALGLLAFASAGLLFRRRRTIA